jgi:hypothetical protein
MGKNRKPKILVYKVTPTAINPASDPRRTAKSENDSPKNYYRKLGYRRCL